MLNPSIKKRYTPLQSLILPTMSYLLYVGLLSAIRLFLYHQAPIVDADEAEQIQLAQHFLLGYPGQPPLYTWLQYLVFQLFGMSLFGLILLKHSLLFFCWYFYYRICQISVQDTKMVWCATLSWALLPLISIDLLLHRTHVILALLMACITWYWIIKPSLLKPWAWFSSLGILIGLGCLSKFNYLIFLLVLIMATFSIKAYRDRFFHPIALLTPFFAILISIPYWIWLIHHPNIGLSTTFKLFAFGSNERDAVIDFLGIALIFLLPPALLCFFFSLQQKITPNTLENKLLWRYHFLLIPTLVILINIAHMRTFFAHWPTPLLFLSPLLWFSLIDKRSYSIRKTVGYLSICLTIQATSLILWSQFPLAYHFELQEKLCALAEQDKKPIHAVVSNSSWLIGTLMLRLHIPHGSLWLQDREEAPPLPQSPTLLMWDGPEITIWINAYHLDPKKIKTVIIEEPVGSNQVHKRAVHWIVITT